MTTTEMIQILTGMTGTLGFCVLFNIRGRRMVMTTLGGFLSWALFVLLSKFIDSDPISFLIVALVITFYSEIMARLLKTPTTTFIITALVPLIPGGSLYYTMAYAFESDAQRFISRAITTLELAAALAIGIIVASTLTKLFFAAKSNIKRKVL